MNSWLRLLPLAVDSIIICCYMFLFILSTLIVLLLRLPGVGLEHIGLGNLEVGLMYDNVTQIREVSFGVFGGGG
jgi:hypothetical protein